MVEKVIKVNDSEQDFDIEKIRNAIIKANNSVNESSRMDDVAIEKVVNTYIERRNVKGRSTLLMKRNVFLS